MYIEKGQHLTVEQIEAKLKEKLQSMLASGYTSKTEKKALKGASDYDIKKLASDLYQLNEALLTGRTVTAICEKQPRNLDSGKHYYSVYFTTEKGELDIVWGGEFLYPLIHQDRQDRDRGMRRYIFASGAIGMSRLLDATDGLFTTLRKITGTYTQINCL